MRHSAESAAREFGQVIGDVLYDVAKRRASSKPSSGINFDLMKLMSDWPPGLFRFLFTAVCPNEHAVEPSTVRKKTLRVLAAMEVLLNARSQKDNVLQQFVSDVRPAKVHMIDKRAVYSRFCRRLSWTPRWRSRRLPSSVS